VLNVPITSVYPSGAAFETASIPMMPLAPGRLSMITGTPSALLSGSAMKRAITSGVRLSPALRRCAQGGSATDPPPRKRILSRAVSRDQAGGAGTTRDQRCFKICRQCASQPEYFCFERVCQRTASSIQSMQLRCRCNSARRSVVAVASVLLYFCETWAQSQAHIEAPPYRGGQPPAWGEFDERTQAMRASRLKVCWLAILAICAQGISVAASGQGFKNGIDDTLGPQFKAVPRFGRGAPRQGGHGPHSGHPLEWHCDRRKRSRPHASCRWRRSGVRRATRPDSREPRHGNRPHRDIRSGQRHRTPLPELCGRQPCRLGHFHGAAVAQAAHDTLSALYPSQATFDRQLAQDLDTIRPSRFRATGIALGRRAAAAILALRQDDGSARAEPRVGIDFITGTEPGDWRQDPVGRSPLALGAYWGAVKPFVLASGAQMRVADPPALESVEYAGAFAEARHSVATAW
jgi:hypothetical protein